jgi:Icc protein
MTLIAQITDTHLLADPEAEMRGVKTWYSLKKVLAVVQNHQPDLLLLTGDLAHEGEKEAYRHLKSLVDETKIPAYWLPGNHDDPNLMAQELSSQFLHTNKVIHLNHWCIILLNSYWQNATYGEGKLATTELDWLETELIANLDVPTAIAVHHHPVPTDIDWLDQISIVNAAELHKIIREFPQVKTVFCGHIHHELNIIQNNIQFLGTPATCTQVTPAGYTLEEGKIQDWEQPGFRLLELKNDGTLASTVHRIHWF